VYSYKIPDQIKSVFGPSVCLALEVLDSLLLNSIGIHLFEAECELKEMPVVRLSDGKTKLIEAPEPSPSPTKSRAQSPLKLSDEVTKSI